MFCFIKYYYPFIICRPKDRLFKIIEWNPKIPPFQNWKHLLLLNFVVQMGWFLYLFTSPLQETFVITSSYMKFLMTPSCAQNKDQLPNNYYSSLGTDKDVFCSLYSNGVKLGDFACHKKLSFSLVTFCIIILFSACIKSRNVCLINVCEWRNNCCKRQFTRWLGKNMKMQIEYITN